jgi:hypothetical protein
MTLKSEDNTERPPTLVPLPTRWQKCYTLNGSIYFINHNQRRTQWDDPRYQPASTGLELREQIVAGQLPIGWGMRASQVAGKPYFVDHNTRTASSDDPRAS